MDGRQGLPAGRKLRVQQQRGCQAPERGWPVSTTISCVLCEFSEHPYRAIQITQHERHLCDVVAIHQLPMNILMSRRQIAQALKRLSCFSEAASSSTHERLGHEDLQLHAYRLLGGVELTQAFQCGDLHFVGRSVR